MSLLNLKIVLNPSPQSGVTLRLFMLAVSFTALMGCQGGSPELSPDQNASGPNTSGPKESSTKISATNPVDAETLHLTPNAIQANGIQTTIIQDQPIVSSIETVGEIRADENKVFHINSPVSGRVVADLIFIGDTVKKGQVVAKVQNLEVAKIHAQFIHELHQNLVDQQLAKTKYHFAQMNYQREQLLFQKGISAKVDFYRAETEAKIAQASLEGLKEHATHIRSEAEALLGVYGNKLENSHLETIQSTSPLRAPLAGVVTKKTITIGDQVLPDTTLYELADLSLVWLDITVYPKDLNKIHVGQPLFFSSDAIPNQTYQGIINYLQPSTQQNSPTFIARAFLKNPSSTLKPGMIGTTLIETQHLGIHPVVPEGAVQEMDQFKIAFVETHPGVYVKRILDLGEKEARGFWVKQGLKAGEKVVTQGSFALKAELLKSQSPPEE
ncbi:MAG: efflux RND transporter periplasmic adaptor subunit [Cyanobacteria bacterium]|nr:efflux RND transporter periplasmic adaptor subunit [Cyanobacteriota bacterium]